LKKKFGTKSCRVKLLDGMLKEANQQFLEAEKIYDEILVLDPNYVVRFLIFFSSFKEKQKKEKKSEKKNTPSPH